MRKLLLACCMLVFGFGLWALMGWAVNARMSRALPAATLPPPRIPQGYPPQLAGLAQGVHNSIAVARDALERGNTTVAVEALDGALRVARAAEMGVVQRPAFHDARVALSQARTAIQDGDRNAARQILDRELDSFTLYWPQPIALPPRNLFAYLGAGVFNARGERLGRVVGVESASVAIAFEPSRDVFGLVDFGRVGPTVLVPSGLLVFGPAVGLGDTDVVLPTLRGRTVLSRSPAVSFR